MTEWRRELIWPCPVEEAVFRVVLEPPEDPSIVEAMKDVTSCAVLKKEWRNEVFITEMDVRMNPPVPDALKALLKPKQLGWIQHATWTPATGEYEVRVVPHLFSSVIKVEKLSVFETLGKNKSRQDMRFRASCDIPLVGKTMENFILQKLLDSIHEQFQQTTAQMTNKVKQPVGKV